MNPPSDPVPHTDVAGDDLARRHTDAGLALRHLAGHPVSDGSGGGQRLILGAVEVIRRPEDGQGRVTFELVDQPVVAVHFLDDDREKPVEERNHLGGSLAGHHLRGSDDVDEYDGDVAFFTAQRRFLALGGQGDLAPHVPAEEIAHAFALAQPVHHRVETALQFAELGAVEYHQVAS